MSSGDNQTIKLISKDGVEFEVNKKDAMISTVIKKELDKDPTKKEFKFDFDFLKLKLIVDFIKNNSNTSTNTK
jgi:hypothetical protein